MNMSVNQDEPLARDIATLNRMALDVIARYSGSAPEDVCLKLNVSQTFMKEVQALSFQELTKIANLGQFLLQPAIEASALVQFTKMSHEQARVHMRSVTRLSRGG
jgi:hypothetical protein